MVKIYCSVGIDIGRDLVDIYIDPRARMYLYLFLKFSFIGVIWRFVTTRETNKSHSGHNQQTSFASPPSNTITSPLTFDLAPDGWLVGWLQPSSW